MATAALPILLSPLLLFALGEAWTDFGGGEKDVLLIIPYFIGALTFLISGTILILKGWRLRRWIIRSIVVAFIVLVVLGLLAYIGSWLGIS